MHPGKYVSSFVNSDFEARLCNEVKKLNFVKVIVIHNSFFFEPDKGLRLTLDFIRSNPGFASGYLVYNPHYIEKSVNIIKDNFGRNGIVGVKMHPEDHRCYITDEKYEPLWKIAIEKNIPVLSHTWNPDVASSSQKYADALLFESIAKKYPGLKVILGHAGAKDYYYYKVIKMLKKNIDKNIFIDIAGDIFYRGMVELFVSEIGSEKILFGSDSPWTDPLLTLLSVLRANISKKDKQNIFYNNAADLFNL